MAHFDLSISASERMKIGRVFKNFRFIKQVSFERIEQDLGISRREWELYESGELLPDFKVLRFASVYMGFSGIDQMLCDSFGAIGWPEYRRKEVEHSDVVRGKLAWLGEMFNTASAK